ncbi:kinase-like protein [Microthyrium microscopicum]|uniref:non-specific serine/threonine protein kinase n=1 Tax=Microthyrium microscopicum TaxID=703497 RepID=A0A6A6UEH3_9PEZI|nr:kinase-like protein [Microthyrium microscopicum]
MAEEERSRAMSLIPYAPDHSREIVLRHESTVVVYDPRSRQLSLRSTTPKLERCPACHRPFLDDPAQHAEHVSSDIPSSTSYMDPSYFNMLRQALPDAGGRSSRPSSPRRRLDSPEHRRSPEPPIVPPSGAEFVASEPRATNGHGISKQAFSSNYFKTFFKEERELGRGGKGVVLLVTHMIDGVSLGQFACKRVPVGDDHAWLEKVLIEVQTLQNLSHPNLVSYRHVWLEDFKINNFGPSNVPCAFILQQYCDSGDLHNFVLGPSTTTPSTWELKERLRRRSKGQMDRPDSSSGLRRMHFEEIYTFFKDITSGLHYLHTHGFIHRDIKPNNVLLHMTGGKMRALLSDFGEVQGTDSARTGTGATGTVSYCAPEVLSRDTPNGPFGNFTVKSDVFSLGMILHFMCFGTLPYSSADQINEDNEDIDELRAEIMSWRGFNDDERRGRTDLPEELWKFLKRLLAIDPDQRPSTDEILRGIHAAQDLEDMDEVFSSRATQEDARSSSRISAASPSPHPRTQFGRKLSGSKTHPGLLPNKALAPQQHRHHSPAHDETERPVSPTTTSAIIRRKHPPPALSPTHHSHSRPSSPQLALPPPPPRPSTLEVWQPALTAVIKIILFLGKYLSLTMPCAPLSSRPLLAIPLLSLAALDFVVESGRSRPRVVSGSTLLLLTVHALVVIQARQRGVLCVRFAERAY